MSGKPKIKVPADSVHGGGPLPRHIRLHSPFILTWWNTLPFLMRMLNPIMGPYPQVVTVWSHSSVRLCDLMGFSPPGSSVHGILYARILEWVAISLSRDLPDPEIKPRSLASPAFAGGFFTTEPPGKPRILRASFKSKYLPEAHVSGTQTFLYLPGEPVINCVIRSVLWLRVSESVRKTRHLFTLVDHFSTNKSDM